MRTLYWLANIPTPYRHHRFRVLAEALRCHGLRLHVLYMADTEPDRPWTYDPADADYAHNIMRGVSGSIRGRPLHFNPGIARLATVDPSLVVIGGVSNPTAWLALRVLARRHTLLLGVESNARSERIYTGPAAALKRWALRQASGYVIPGEASKGYIGRTDANNLSKPVVRLPNIINEQSFLGYDAPKRSAERQRARQELNLRVEDRLILVPARLEPYKGIEDILKAVEMLRCENLPIRVAFAGTGSLRRQVDATALGGRAQALGQRSVEQMASLYAASDCMLLPSHRDASPLSVVEAIFAGLPLALSDAVGNIHEALVENDNGWSFPAGDVGAIKTVLERVGKMPDRQLEQMRRRSLEVHRDQFDSDRVARNAAYELARLAEGS